jgi:hypothetical protein
MGGHIQDSPDGTYSLHVWAPMSPRRGGTYNINLVQKSTGRTLRNVTVSLPASELSASVREGGASVAWDTAGNYADVSIDGTQSVRVWVPTK